MSGCPYTWFKSFFSGSKDPDGNARHLRVTVIRDNDVKVDVALPAGSARWLIDLIPEDVILKIREEGIPIDSIQSDLAKKTTLVPGHIFSLVESERSVNVWLE